MSLCCELLCFVCLFCIGIAVQAAMDPNCSFTSTGMDISKEKFIMFLKQNDRMTIDFKLITIFKFTFNYQLCLYNRIPRPCLSANAAYKIDQGAACQNLWQHAKSGCTSTVDVDTI
jgi:hypothetical protein